MRASSRRSVFAVGLLAVVLGIAGIAWACTGPTVGYSGDARPGGEIIMHGSNFQTSPDIQIIWDRGTASEQLLGTAPGPSFKVTLTIPADANPGQHWLTATQGSSDRATSGAAPEASVSIRISDPQETSGGGGGSTDPVTSRTADGSPSGSDDAVTTAQPRFEAERTSGPVTVTTADGDVVFGGSLPVAEARAAKAAARPAAAGSAYSDLVAGFGAYELDSSPSLIGAERGLDEGSNAGPGALLLAVGLALTAVGAFGAVAMRRSTERAAG